MNREDDQIAHIRSESRHSGPLARQVFDEHEFAGRDVVLFRSRNHVPPFVFREPDQVQVGRLIGMKFSPFLSNLRDARGGICAKSSQNPGSSDANSSLILTGLP